MPNSISIMSDSFYNVVKTHPVKWKHGTKQRFSNYVLLSEMDKKKPLSLIFASFSKNTP